MDSRLTADRPTWKSHLPSGIASLALHALVLLLAGSSLRGCQKGMPGDPGGDQFREVGLFLVDGSDSGTNDNASGITGAGSEHRETPVADQSEASPDESPNTPFPSDILPTEVPDVDSLTAVASETSTVNSDSNSERDATDSDAVNLIGPGAPLAGLPANGSPSGRRSQQNQSEGGSPAAVGTGVPGPGQTAFMEIVDTGRSFIYVVDTSSSMAEGNRLNMAKSQLKASLRLLQPDQQFQVIFYNEAPSAMRLGKSARGTMYYATASNKLLAERQIDREVAENGTAHLPALEEALKLKPDVIYFLTDGDTENLLLEDMKNLARISPGTTIHVVQFASTGLTSRAISWLEILAGQFRGEFRRFEASGN